MAKELTIKELEELANKGDADAQLELGNRYFDMDEKYWTKAVHWYEEAIKNGKEKEGYKSLGNLHGIGIDYKTTDIKKGIEYLEKYLELGGTEEWVTEELGYRYKYTPPCIDYNKAFYYYSKTDLTKNTNAYELGSMLVYGCGCQKDLDRGIKLLSYAAEQGEVDAYWLLENDFNITVKDKYYDKYVEYLKRGAKNGKVDDMFNLAHHYLYPERKYYRKNVKKALELFKKAADLGYLDAQRFYGDLLVDGGIAYDMEEGKKYLKMAAEQGNEKDIRTYNMYKDLPF